MPFLNQLQDLCKAYKEAPNEIRQSEIFRTASALLAKQKLRGVRGVLARISTTHGGDELSLRVVVEGGNRNAVFATESIFAPIPRGNKVYRQAADLSENKCVLFSVSGLKPNSMMEVSKVCDWDFFARFTDLTACEAANEAPSSTKE